MTGRDPGDEAVEVVDEAGVVVGVVTRREMRAGGLRHRSTYIAVVTSAGELVVHQRADWKDVYPGWWDVAFGGVCGVGEPWLEAAQRELREEAGIADVALADLGPASYDRDDGHLVARVYLARHDGRLTCPDGEVVAVDTVPIHRLDQWLDGRNVATDSRELVLPLLGPALSSDLKNR